MRKITFLFGLLLIAATIVSCDKKIIEERFDPEPSAGNVTPIYNPDYINMSCEDLTGGPYVGEGSGRVNYNSETGEFDNNGAWPYGLVVTVTDGKYVEFHFPEGAQTQYCVGAVIVKGGNGANVYYYTPGTKSDAELASPVNASGNPADLSNLTFCFVECPPDLVVAVKSWYWSGSETGYRTWAGSCGSYIFSSYWCQYMGINYFPGTSEISLHQDYKPLNLIGDVKILQTGINTLQVTVDLNDGLILDKTHIYVGTMEGLLNSVVGYCPDYEASPWQTFDVNGNIQTFNVNF